MKKLTLLVCFIIILLAGCQGTQPLPTPPSGSEVVSTTPPSMTPVPTRRATATPIPLTPNPSATSTTTRTATSTPAFPEETRLDLQCLEVAPSLPSEAVSSGTVVLGRGVGDQQRRYETELLDLASGQTTQIVTQNEFQLDHVLSSDRTLMAYRTVIFNADGIAVNEELVIATVDGLRQNVIPWEEAWRSILGWTNDLRLLLLSDEPVLGVSGEQVSPVSYLVLDPFSGERQILRPDFPDSIDSRYLISWSTGQREIYNPTLTRAIYLRYIGSDEETYTFAVWDVVEQRLVTSLEEIYTNGVQFSRTSPLPVWSPDGSQFVVTSMYLVPDRYWAVFELYRVTQDGQVEQLTHLTPFMLLQGADYSWSTDERMIAITLYPWEIELTNERSVAVLDMETLEVTYYCFPVRGLEPPAPIWSPDGTQFLVVDEGEDGHRHVILVDIAHGFAAQIAEDMDPVGWMAAP